MSLRAPPQFQTRNRHALQSPSRVSDVDRVICLSRQKLQLERARDEPDLRRLLAHVCTFEHLQGWLCKNPPSRKAPSPPQGDEVPTHKDDISPCSPQTEIESSISRLWPIGDLRSTVTVVREVESDEDSDDADSDSGEESWDAFDISDNAIFDFSADEPGICQPDCSSAPTACQDFAYEGEEVAQTWAATPKLLSSAQFQEPAKMIHECYSYTSPTPTAI